MCVLFRLSKSQQENNTRQGGRHVLTDKVHHLRRIASSFSFLQIKLSKRQAKCWPKLKNELRKPQREIVVVPEYTLQEILQQFVPMLHCNEGKRYFFRGLDILNGLFSERFISLRRVASSHGNWGRRCNKISFYFILKDLKLLF